MKSFARLRQFSVILTVAVVGLALPAASHAATAITATAADTSLLYGDNLTVSGTVAPAAAEPVTLELSTNRGTSYSVLTTGTSAADGTFSLQAAPTTNGLVRVRNADGTVASVGFQVTVAPRITVTKVGRGTTFIGARVNLTIAPATYRGKLVFAAGRGSAAQTLTTTVKRANVSVLAPTPAVGRVRITISSKAWNGLSVASTSATTTASARALASGSRGPDVKALNMRLRELGFHTPPASNRFDYRLADAVLAFHKSQRMSRTMRVSVGTWARLVSARPMQPRYGGNDTHIEVNKKRQILMVVKKGKVLGTIHVSTGATDNTPLGKFRIYQKGGSYLPKFMAFHGNFGIHGYNPVPSFPASHGCVREPIWIAGWTFSHMKIGDRVYVYNS